MHHHIVYYENYENNLIDYWFFNPIIMHGDVDNSRNVDAEF